jgi:hypothetical protein
MAIRDTADRSMLRMQVQRYVTRCEGQASQIQRADSLREISRLASMPLSYPLSDEPQARDAQRQLQTQAEDRAREIIIDQIKAYERAEESAQSSLLHNMNEAWSNLTGPLGHLRTWATKKLAAANANR